MGRWSRLSVLLAALLALHGAAQVEAARYEQVTLKSSAAVTATGTTTGVDLLKIAQATDSRHKGTLVAIYLDITAASGTSPTFDLKVQCSPNNTTWYDPASTAANRDSFAFAQKTAAGTDVKIIPDMPCRYVRLSYTVGGTSPSFTFSVVGDFVTGDYRQMDP